MHDISISHTAAPQVNIKINSGGIPTLGMQFIFTCKVSVNESLIANKSYQWIKNNRTQTKENSNTLNFSNLKLSDAGYYICVVTLNDSLMQNASGQLALTNKFSLFTMII